MKRGVMCVQAVENSLKSKFYYYLLTHYSCVCVFFCGHGNEASPHFLRPRVNYKAMKLSYNNPPVFTSTDFMCLFFFSKKSSV